MKEIVEILTKKNKTISSMESCTGGYFASELTNIEGASEVFKYSAVTYSNEFKIKMGVDPKIIEKYTVYSKETAESMAQSISLFTESNYGVGITGKLKKLDKSNKVDVDDDVVFVSIYSKDDDKYYNAKIKVYKNTRKENKETVVNELINKIKEIIK